MSKKNLGNIGLMKQHKFDNCVNIFLVVTFILLVIV
jgi:hypothetical protein